MQPGHSSPTQLSIPNMSDTPRKSSTHQRGSSDMPDISSEEDCIEPLAEQTETKEALETAKEALKAFKALAGSKIGTLVATGERIDKINKPPIFWPIALTHTHDWSFFPTSWYKPGRPGASSSTAGLVAGCWRDCGHAEMPIFSTWWVENRVGAVKKRGEKRGKRGIQKHKNGLFRWYEKSWRFQSNLKNCHRSNRGMKKLGHETWCYSYKREYSIPTNGLHWGALVGSSSTLELYVVIICTQRRVARMRRNHRLRIVVARFLDSDECLNFSPTRTVVAIWRGKMSRARSWAWIHALSCSLMSRSHSVVRLSCRSIWTTNSTTSAALNVFSVRWNSRGLAGPRVRASLRWSRSSMAAGSATTFATNATPWSISLTSSCMLRTWRVHPLRVWRGGREGSRSNSWSAGDERPAPPLRTGCSMSLLSPDFRRKCKIDGKFY